MCGLIYSAGPAWTRCSCAVFIPETVFGSSEVQRSCGFYLETIGPVSPRQVFFLKFPVCDVLLSLAYTPIDGCGMICKTCFSECIHTP